MRSQELRRKARVIQAISGSQLEVRELNGKWRLKANTGIQPSHARATSYQKGIAIQEPRREFGGKLDSGYVGKGEVMKRIPKSSEEDDERKCRFSADSAIGRSFLEARGSGDE